MEIDDPVNGISVSRDPDHLCNEISDSWEKILSRFRTETGNDLLITCTYRSPKEQTRLYSLGRTVKGKIVTWVDGVKKKSFHNYFPARAVDVAVIVGGKVSWNKKDYLPLESIAKEFGLEWGGHWKGKEDICHIQVRPKAVP